RRLVERDAYVDTLGDGVEKPGRGAAGGDVELADGQGGDDLGGGIVGYLLDLDALLGEVATLHTDEGARMGHTGEHGNLHRLQAGRGGGGRRRRRGRPGGGGGRGRRGGLRARPGGGRAPRARHDRQRARDRPNPRAEPPAHAVLLRGHADHEASSTAGRRCPV